MGNPNFIGSGVVRATRLNRLCHKVTGHCRNRFDAFTELLRDARSYLAGLAVFCSSSFIAAGVATSLTGIEEWGEFGMPIVISGSLPVKCVGSCTFSVVKASCPSCASAWTCIVSPAPVTGVLFSACLRPSLSFGVKFKFTQPCPLIFFIINAGPSQGSTQATGPATGGCGVFG